MIQRTQHLYNLLNGHIFTTTIWRDERILILPYHCLQYKLTLNFFQTYRVSAEPQSIHFKHRTT